MFEMPFVHKTSLPEVIQYMVDTVNEEIPDTKELLDIEYKLGQTQGYEVLVVIRKKGGGSGTCLEVESMVGLVDDL